MSATASRFWWAERICWTISIAVMAGAVLFLLVAVYPPGGPPVVAGGPKVDPRRPLPDWITDQYQRARQTAGTAS